MLIDVGEPNPLEAAASLSRQVWMIEDRLLSRPEEMTH